MNESKDSAKSIMTMSELAHELKRRRLATGISSIPELLKKTKEGYPLPRSTAYALEEGSHISNWIAVEAHLRACDATESEIADFREIHQRVLVNSRGRDSADARQAIIPTAKQLAEMGPEEAARTLSEIDPERAADLLRRIEIKHAAKLVPEIHLSIVLSLLANVGQARATLIFEQINIERGAELLAEMKPQEAFCILDELARSRAARLVASMPRGRAAKVLRNMPSDDAVRMLAAMEANHAADLLGELDIGILERLAGITRPQVVAAILQWSDSELAGTFLMKLPEQRAMEILAKIDSSAIPRFIEKLENGVAHNLLAQIPAQQIGAVVSSLSSELRIEVLCSILPADRAGAAILSWEGRHYWEGSEYLGDLLLTLQEIPADRLAAIMQTMGQHERILILAIIDGPFQRRILAEFPSSDIETIKEELLPQNLAKHIVEVDPDRACAYLDYIDVPVGVIFSTLPPDSAAEIIKRNGTYDSMAQILAQVPPQHAGPILQGFRAGEAAGIVVCLPGKVAAPILTNMSMVSADQIMAFIDRRADPDAWGGYNLSREEKTAERTRREGFADFLRAALAEAHQSTC